MLFAPCLQGIQDGTQGLALFSQAVFDLWGDHGIDLAVDETGLVWVATHAGLAALDLSDLSFTRHDEVSTAGGLRDPDVLSIAPGHGGAVWVGARSGLFRFLPDEPVESDARWVELADFVDIPSESLSVDATGAVWAATERGAVQVAGEPPAVARIVDATDGLPSAAVLSVHAGVRGGIWIGTESGLARAVRLP